MGAEGGGAVDETLEDGGGDGLGGVADAEGDYVGGGVLFEVRVAAAADLGEEVSVRVFWGGG